MKVATREQMNKLDQEAIADYGIPGLLLMERAAYKVYEYIMRKNHEKIIIFCGKGNNGGDGFALARQLVMWGHKEVAIIFVGQKEKMTADAKVYYDICKHLKISLMDYETSKEKVNENIRSADAIIDGLFGTGLSKKITEPYLEVINLINAVEHAEKISIDIPSGIECNTGKVLGAAVKADRTITFEFLKPGLCIYPGVMHAGTVDVVDIGIPVECIEAMDTTFEAIDEKVWKEALPKRYFRSNKGTYGKVLIIGGAKGMAGAVILSTKACMKVGAGLVSVAVPDIIYPIVEASVWEAMTIGCSHDGHSFTEHARLELVEKIEKSNVVGIGPGIGRGEAISSLIEDVLARQKPCVIDADGLYALKPHLAKLKNRKSPTILTPHPGELSYLTGKTIEEILENSVEICWQFAKNYDVVLVLKLERTLIATKEKVYINTTGNSSLAKGGSGDVLTGMITGFLAQGVSAACAAILGVYGHGKAADLMVTQKSPYSLLPSDLYEGIEKLFIE